MLRSIVLSFTLLAPLGASASAPAPAAATPVATGTTVVAKSADGKASWTVRIDGGHVESSGPGGQRYVGELRGDKRDYRQASDGAAFVEVKGSEKGFKLHAPGGKLLWKVKFDADKIKISDNEENAHAWELKIKDNKTRIVDPDGKEIGEVRYHADAAKVKVKDSTGADLFSIDAKQASAAYGVLPLTTLPEAHRAIILGEILARNR